MHEVAHETLRQQRAEHSTRPDQQGAACIGCSAAAHVLLLPSHTLQASGISGAGRLALRARRSPVQQAVRRLQARHATAGDALKAAFTKQRQHQWWAAVVRQLRQGEEALRAGVRWGGLHVSCATAAPVAPNSGKLPVRRSATMPTHPTPSSSCTQTAAAAPGPPRWPAQRPGSAG